MLFEDTSTRIIKWLIYIAVLLLAFLIAFPFYWMVSNSFKPLAEIMSYPPTIVPRSFTLEAFPRVFATSPFARWYLNTTLVALGGSFTTVLVSAPAAYALAVHKFRGSQLLSFYLMASIMVPPMTALLPLYMLLRDLQLINTHFGLVFAYVGFHTAFAIFLIQSYFETLPKELVDAARIDGANDLSILVRIFIPLSRPIFVTVAVFNFVWAWNEYLFSLVVISKETKMTLSVGIEFFFGTMYRTPDWNLVMAAATLGLLPSLLLFVRLQRHFISGVTMGAVKS